MDNKYHLFHMQIFSEENINYNAFENDSYSGKILIEDIEKKYKFSNSVSFPDTSLRYKKLNDQLVVDTNYNLPKVSIDVMKIFNVKEIITDIVDTKLKCQFSSYIKLDNDFC
ncbi:hypothetical protein GVAV_001232 [Gurleya vavrai]